jgi:hypothetical protein
MTMIAKGKHEALAIQWSQVTAHEKSGNEEIRVLFEIVGDEDNGKTITWYGYFTDKTAERTVESLRYMGWAGQNILDIQGLDKNKVQLVIEHDDYSGQPKAKVAWVNRLVSVYMGTPMDEVKKKAFADRMKGLVLASKQSGGSSPNTNKGSGADFPHGANAPKDDIDLGL